MSARTPQEILGLEFDWLASGMDGHVAFLSTAGAGYAPAAFLADADAHQDAIDAILGMPATTTARFAPALVEECKNTWLRMAERGLFAYDSSPNGGPCTLVAAPHTPTVLPALPLLAQQVARRLSLPGLRFATLPEIAAGLLRANEPKS